jgi:hypothetical protein
MINKFLQLAALLIILVDYNAEGQDLLVSASRHGIIACADVSNDNTHVLDIKHRKIIGTIDSPAIFLCWLKDSGIICLTNSAQGSFIVTYEISPDTVRAVDSIPVEPTIRDILDYPVEAFPNRIDSVRGFFFVSVQNDSLYKIFPLTHDTVELGSFKPLEGFRYNSMTVNDNGSLVFASQISEHYGMISELDTRTRHTRVIARGKGFGSGDTRVGFLEDDYNVIYYKVISENDSVTLHQLTLYDTRNRAYRNIGIVMGEHLLNSLEILPMRKIIVNYLGAHPIDLTKVKPGIESYLRAIIGNIGIIEIKI